VQIERETAVRPIILASIALLAVSTSASAFDKCADPMALRTLEEIRACQWRVHQAQVMEEERIALVLSIAKNSGAAKGGARVESLEVVPHVSAKDPHYAARTNGAPTLVFVPTSD
jgi:hypothetical protein